MSTFDPFALCQPGLRDIKPYQPGSTAEQIEEKFGIRDALKLASNENLLGPSERVAQALNDGGKEARFYPDGAGRALKELLAAHCDVTPAQITLGNGSNELLELIARGFLAPAKSAAYSQHAFAAYELVTKLSGAKAVVAAARSPADESMPYGCDLAAMGAAIGPATAVVFIANPNNPTGTWLATSELYDFVRAVPANTIVVIDEAYAEYVEAPDYPSCAGWLAEFPNLIVTRTFSKLFALAGLRIGYAVSSPAIADILDRLRQPFNVNALAQAAAAVALSDRAHIAKSIALNREGLAILREGLEGMNLACLPSAANFICCEVGDAQSVYKRLLEQGVIVRPIGGYDLPCHLRITVGLPEHNERFLSAMRRVMRRVTA